MHNADERTFGAGLFAVPKVTLTRMCSEGAQEPGDVPTDIVDAVLSLATSWPELAAAEELLTARCLRSKGFEVPLHGSATLSALTPPTLSGITGLLDESARQVGYGDQLHSEPPNDAVGQFANSLAADDRASFEEALTGGSEADDVQIDVGNQKLGAPSSGCVAGARIELYGSVEIYLRLRYLPLEVVGQGVAVLKSADVLAAFGRHSEALKAAGYDVRSLKDVRRLAKSRFGMRRPGEPASEEEIRLAVADLDAQLQADLRGYLNREALRLAASYLHRHAHDIRSLKLSQDEARSSARRILASQ